MKKTLMVLVLGLMFASPALATWGDGQVKKENEEIRELRASRGAEIKEMTKEFKNEIETKRQEFKTKLAALRDARKKTIVENMDKRFAEVNAKRTSEMAKHLDRMTEILSKVSGDTSSASAAIQKAKDANTAQAAKSYVITITTEANLRMDVGKVRSQLEADLKAVHELVVAARTAVRASIK